MPFPSQPLPPSVTSLHQSERQVLYSASGSRLKNPECVLWLLPLQSPNSRGLSPLANFPITACVWTITLFTAASMWLKPFQRSIHHYRNDGSLTLHAEPSQIWAHHVANRNGLSYRIFFLKSCNSGVFGDVWPRVISEGLAALAAYCMIWKRMHLGKACIGVWKSCGFLICAEWKPKNMPPPKNYNFVIYSCHASSCL